MRMGGQKVQLHAQTELLPKSTEQEAGWVPEAIRRSEEDNNLLSAGERTQPTDRE